MDPVPAREIEGRRVANELTPPWRRSSAASAPRHPLLPGSAGGEFVPLLSLPPSRRSRRGAAASLSLSQLRQAGGARGEQLPASTLLNPVDICPSGMIPRYRSI